MLPLLVAIIALQLDEKPVVRREGDAGGGGNALQEFVGNTRAQGGLLWETVAQRQVWLPALFIFLWQATPSCGDAFFYFITDDLGIGPEFLGRVKVGTSLASIFGIWCYRTYLQDVPIKVTLKWTAIASVVAGLSQLLLVTHVNRDLGTPHAPTHASPTHSSLTPTPTPTPTLTLTPTQASQTRSSPSATT